MSQTQHTHDIPHGLVEDVQLFLDDYYRDDIAALAQNYPNDQRSLRVSHADIYQFDMALADDLIEQPEVIIDVFEDALGRVDLPVDVDLSGAHVRPHALPAAHTFHPGGFSPTDRHGTLVGVEGEVSKATDEYSRLVRAVFECERCGTPTEVLQTDGEFQEPHECQGCERQGPFSRDDKRSTFVDAQKLRLTTPPELAQGDGSDIDVYVEDDLADMVTVGDRVTVTGVVHFDQSYRGNAPENKFDPFLDGLDIEVEQTDAEDLDLSATERERIERLASGEKGDPLELAARSYAPKILGYTAEKKALLLALVGGSRVEYGPGDWDRGEFHVLLIGDPSTAKSKLVTWAETVGWRTVGTSGKGATVAGVTASAVQDDFGDGSWTLDAGAAVKAHKGVLAIDELDDMPADVRAALLEPMSKQTISINKGGINSTLQTQTAVIAAANPKHGRFDPYEPWVEQFDLSSALLQRFDLIYRFRDVPDEEGDRDIAEHVLSARDEAKRGDGEGERLDVPVDDETLHAWIALAKQQPEPVFADESVKARIRESFTDLRSLHGYDDTGGDPVPVTFRTLEGLVRIAEAAARFELSDTIDERHVSIATSLVGESMQQIGKDPETGNLDADIHETGSSTSQRERRKQLVDVIEELDAESDDHGAAIEDVVARMDAPEGTIHRDIEVFCEQGEAVRPSTDRVRYIGGF